MARDFRRYDPEVQLLANRGFAVFQPNFRGSSGYGSEFEARGYRQWGLSMQRDLSEGVRWLIDQGIADADRIAIYGASYGGYAALMGLVVNPELYRAGASYAGVTSLTMHLADNNGYEGLSAFGNRVIGRAWRDRRELKETSPLENADKVQAPVLLAHGENDSRVHVKHSAKMANALRRAGKDVEYLEFENEIHGFILEQNRIAFYHKLASFLEENLASRDVAAGAVSAANAAGAASAED